MPTSSNLYYLLSLAQIAACGYLIQGIKTIYLPEDSQPRIVRRLLSRRWLAHIQWLFIPKKSSEKILYFHIFILGGVWFLSINIPANLLWGNTSFAKIISPDYVPFILAFIARVMDNSYYTNRIEEDIKLGKDAKQLGKQAKLMISKGRVPEECLVESCYDYSLIMFTMTNNKVYIGWLKEFVPDSDGEWLSIALIRSGYRTKDTLQVTLDIDYSKYYTNPDIDKKSDESIDAEREFNVFLPMDKIISIQRFSADIYAKEFESRTVSREAGPDLTPET